MAIRLVRTGHLVLRVKDLERSKRFFTEVLGLNVVGVNRRNMVFFSSDFDENHHMLAIREAADKDLPDPAPETQLGMEHVAYELESFAALQEAWRIFKDNDVTIHHTVWHGVAKSIYFLDPDGNMLEVYCNVPVSEYEGTVDNHFGSYGSLEAELEGAPQKPGSVAP